MKTSRVPASLTDTFVSLSPGNRDSVMMLIEEHGGQVTKESRRFGGPQEVLELRISISTDQVRNFRARISELSFSQKDERMATSEKASGTLARGARAEQQGTEGMA